jgi:CheY-like chemotaxis protein
MSSDHQIPNAGDQENSRARDSTSDSLKILLVEDHLDTRLGMEILLRRSHHYVRSSDSAKAALNLAASEAFDVVITDIGLPDMNGIELMRLLRDRYGLQSIAISGYGESQELLSSGEFLHHLTKPIRMEQLRDLLLELQAMKRAH